MGLSISYSGSLNKAAPIPEVVAWLHQLCKEIKWRCNDMTQQVSGVLLRPVDESKGTSELVEVVVKGVYIYPPGCETLLLMFDPSGKLVHYFEIPKEALTQQAQDSGQAYYLDSPNWCKTTGEPESHLLIVLILRELKKRFMRNLKVRDDTGYWKTGSMEDLLQQHRGMAALIASFDGKALQAVLGLAGVDIGDPAKVKRLDSKLTSAPRKRSPSKRKPN